MMQLIPASAQAFTQSSNGKKASLASAAPRTLSPLRSMAICVLQMRLTCPGPMPKLW